MSIKYIYKSIEFIYHYRKMIIIIRCVLYGASGKLVIKLIGLLIKSGCFVGL